MNRNNLVLLDAPHNSGGITLDGDVYEVDENSQALIPAHLTGEAIQHGFKVAESTPIKEKPAKLEKSETAKDNAKTESK